MVKDYTNLKRGMLAIGAILLIVGIILLIYGFMNFGGLFGQSTDTQQAILQKSNTGFNSIMIMAAGGFMLVIGIGLIYWSQFRRVASYVATEASPALTTASNAIGKGLKESDAMGNKSEKEVIKIKCRHCGYLESEDAEFCSKCGKKV